MYGETMKLVDALHTKPNLIAAVMAGLGGRYCC